MGYNDDRLIYYKFDVSGEDAVETNGYKHVFDLLPGEKIVDTWAMIFADSDVNLRAAVEHDGGLAAITRYSSQSGSAAGTITGPDLLRALPLPFGMSRYTAVADPHRVFAAYLGTVTRTGRATVWVVVATADDAG